MLSKEVNKKIRKLFDDRNQGYNKTKTDAYYITFPQFVHHITETPSHELNQHWMPFTTFADRLIMTYNVISLIRLSTSNDTQHML